MKSICQKLKSFLGNIGLLMISVMTIVFLLEVVFYCINQSSLGQRELIGDYIVDDPDVGYKPKASSKEIIIKKSRDGTAIYNVTYTTDKHSRRITLQKNSTDSHLLFFGGSFVFGVGLNDDESLPYYLSGITDHSVYNYGGSGYGPNMMLAQLSKDSFVNEIKEKKGAAIYAYIDNHVRRVIGDIWIDDRAPYFYLNRHNILKRKGNFLTSRLLRKKLYKELRRSQVFKYWKIRLPLFVTSRDVYLTSMIIKKSAEIYRSKFKGKFYVLIYPGQRKYSKNIIDLLKDSDVCILDYSNLLEDYYWSEYYIDKHPNFLLNKMIAERIVKDLH